MMRKFQNETFIEHIVPNNKGYFLINGYKIIRFFIPTFLKNITSNLS